MFEFKKNTKIVAKPGSEVWNIDAKSDVIDYEKLWENHAELAFADDSIIGMFLYRRQHMAQMSQNLKQACERLVKNTEFIERLKAAKFDVIFAHMADFCPIGLQHVIKAPTWVWVSSGPLLDHMASLAGLSLPASYAAPVLADLGDTLTFFERFKSILGHTVTPYAIRAMSADAETETFRKYIDPNFPHLFDLAKTAPLIFVNTNELYDLPRPTLHKIINIGGIEKPSTISKPLPAEYAEKIEAAKNVVVFTFGSIANASKMPESWKDAFMGAFEQFPDTQFFVRFDGSNLKPPKNVHLSKWLPQVDLLQHPKTKAFITHGGYNGLQEALVAAKPLLVVPLFGDQFKNARIAEKHGFGITLKKSEMSKEKVAAALEALLNDPKYSKAVKQMNAMIKKQPVAPETLLIRWTEFVAEFKNLNNLRPVGASLDTITYYNIDVYATVLTVFSFVLFVLYKIFAFFIFKIARLLGLRKEKTE
uniref:UDP-glucuronosyltransferase n=1 Tax=Panagrolaimus sp. ES5 TaxID=591445 RepID=A0AC34F4P8_9BILA